jgi:ribosomal protein S18 acetylase RimI-like enzyme
VTYTLGPLAAGHRAPLAELLLMTHAFRPDEIAVALALFDETVLSPGKPGADYEFVGAFGHAGSLAGYCCYGPTPGAEGTYDVYWIAVDPSHQGGGVGSTLLAEVERRLGERRARLLVVETSGTEGYELARRFYGGRGYHLAARLRDFYAPADDRIVFTRHLERSPSPALRGV